jgi:hypothetical protein
MGGTEALGVRRIVAPAVDLGHDLVDVGRGTTAGSGFRGPPPRARRLLEPDMAERREARRLEDGTDVLGRTVLARADAARVRPVLALPHALARSGASSPEPTIRFAQGAGAVGVISDIALAWGRGPSE